MSLQAVGWLSAKLGIDIAGHPARATDVDATHTSSGPHNTAPDTLTGGEEGANSGSVQAKLGQYWHQMQTAVSDYLGNGPNSRPFDEVFLCDDGNAHEQGGMSGMGRGVFSGTAQSQGMTTAGLNNGGNVAENTELDADGLPVTKNWYYFDKALNRWSVSPDAPESIRREFEEKLREAEQERLGLKPAVPPPPPRPPIATTAYNNTALPPPPQQQQQQRGMFGTGPHRAPGPHYAMPTYFSPGPIQQAMSPIATSTTTASTNSGGSPHEAVPPPAMDSALGRQPVLAPIRTAFPPPPSLHAQSNTTTPLLAAQSAASPLSGISQAPAMAASQADASSSSRTYQPSTAFMTPAFPPPPTALATPTAAISSPHHATSSAQTPPSWSSHATPSPLAPPPPPVVANTASYNATQLPGRLPQPSSAALPPPPTATPQYATTSSGAALPPPPALYGVEAGAHAGQPVARTETTLNAPQTKPPSMPPPPPAYAPFSI